MANDGKLNLPHGCIGNRRFPKVPTRGFAISYKYLHSSRGPGGPSWGGILLVFESLGGLLKRTLPTASLKDSVSSKDNLIEIRTKIIVGVMP